MTGIDLFIEACRWQGLNPAMIRTGYAEFEVTVTKPAPSESEIQKEIEKHCDGVRQLLAKQTDEKSRSHLETVLQKIPGVVRARSTGTRRSRIKVLFDGNDVTFGKRRFEVTSYDPAANGWEQPQIGLRRGLTKEGGDNVLWDAGASMATVTKDSVGIPVEFQAFGRMEGTPSKLATAALLNGSDSERFHFPPEGVAAFQAQAAKLAAGGNMTPLELAGEAEYDGGAMAFVVQSRLKTASGSRRLQRYWIDPSRGYVCPLIELYDNNHGNLVAEWKSNGYFLHEKSGLWFPAKYSYTEYVDGKNIREQRTYEVDRKTLQVNQAVSDEEFGFIRRKRRVT